MLPTFWGFMSPNGFLALTCDSRLLKSPFLTFVIIDTASLNLTKELHPFSTIVR